MEMKKEFGLRVKKIREDMHMTKEEFAKQLGISGQFLGLVEHGKNYLSIENLKKLCEITNFSADYLLFGKNTYPLQRKRLKTVAYQRSEPHLVGLCSP